MNTEKYEIAESIPPAEELIKLRRLVEWPNIDKASMEKGLANSLYGVYVAVDKEIIGTARIVGDGSTYFIYKM